MLDGSYFFECRCSSDEDTLRFVLCKEENYKEIYLTIFLDNRPWWERLWLGLKYIFGYKCKYGHFNCWILRAEDADKLGEMVRNFQQL